MSNFAIKISVQFVNPVFLKYFITDPFLPTGHLFGVMEYALENSNVVAFIEYNFRREDIKHTYKPM